MINRWTGNTFFHWVFNSQGLGFAVFTTNLMNNTLVTLLLPLHTNPSIHMHVSSDLFCSRYIAKVKESESNVDLQFESEQTSKWNVKFSLPVTRLMPYYAETGHSHPFCYDSTECAGGSGFTLATRLSTCQVFSADFYFF